MRGALPYHCSADSVVAGMYSYPSIREMELTFALSHWDTLKASTALKEKALEVANGSRPYAGEVLFELLSGRH